MSLLSFCVAVYIVCGAVIACLYSLGDRYSSTKRRTLIMGGIWLGWLPMLIFSVVVDQIQNRR